MKSYPSLQLDVLVDQESKNEIGVHLLPPSTLSKQGSSLSIRPPEASTCEPPPTHGTTSPSSSVVTHRSAHEPEPHDSSKIGNARFCQTPSGSDLSSIHETAKLSTDVPAGLSQGPQSNLTTGSRLLALASRPPQNPAGHSPISFSQKSGHIGMGVPVGAGGNHLGETPATESFRPHDGFYPFGDRRERGCQVSSSEAAFHSLAFTGEQTLSQTISEQVALSELGVGVPGNVPGQPLDCVSTGVAAAKGSRFAKFFDGKGRETHASVASKGGMGNLGPLPPTGAQKVEIGGLNASGNADARTMEDIFAMLSNSAHVSA